MKRTIQTALAGLLFAAYGCGNEETGRTETVETSMSPGSAVAARAGESANTATGTNAGAGAAAPSTGTGGAGAGGAKSMSATAGTAAGSGEPGAGAPAAGSGGSTTPAGAPTFSAIYTEILTKGATGNCMFAACHGGPPDPAVNGGLQIKAGDKAGAYKNLVDAASTGAVCGGKTYVIPGDSAGSLLVQKLADAPPCGAKMPIGSPLTAAQVAQIAQWIDDGAEDN